MNQNEYRTKIKNRGREEDSLKKRMDGYNTGFQ